MAEENEEATKPVNFDVPDQLEYSENHVWVERDDDFVTIGLTEYAVKQLGELVFVDLLEEGTDVEIDDEIAQLESSKAVQPLLSPVTGTISHVNSEVSRDPSVITDDPYGEGWIVKITLDEDVEPELLDASQYAAFTK